MRGVNARARHINAARYTMTQNPEEIKCGKVRGSGLFYWLPRACAAGRSVQAPAAAPHHPHAPAPPRLGWATPKPYCTARAFSCLLDMMSLSDIAASCPLDFMTCSVALDVMPHSATSRATGDDMSTMVDSNSGVKIVHPTKCVYLLTMSKQYKQLVDILGAGGVRIVARRVTSAFRTKLVIILQLVGDG